MERASGGSDLSGFYRLRLDERNEIIGRVAGIGEDARTALLSGGLAAEHADRMIENAIGVFSLPLGVCVNLRLDGRDRLVPMAIEEPSVIAAASHAAKLLRASGGIRSEVAPPIMEGQVQILDVDDPVRAEAAVRTAADYLLSRANRAHPRLIAAGGGARAVTVRHLPRADAADPLPPMLVVHLAVDVREAMGANVVNAMCEELASDLEILTSGRARLRIVTNLCDKRTVTVRGSVPIGELAGRWRGGGLDVARGIVEASVFAERDPYRATTHNKGIMNGVDAVLLAFGQDWRAVEAGAHAYAARSGRYGPLARWRLDGDLLNGEMTLPMAVGLVGGALLTHPGVSAALEVAKIAAADELASIAAAVGLAQNLGALRALAAEGIQAGHMRLHARKLDGARGVNPLEGSEPLCAEPLPAPCAEDEAFCSAILPRVSRTFALSIEALPSGLREPVRVGYLLCRIVDTIEDEPGLDAARRQALFTVFDSALSDGSDLDALPRECADLTDDGAGGALCRGASAVLRCFRALPSATREAVRQRLLEMSRGMRLYSARGDAGGGRRIVDLEDLARYCYFVAGTVGELLTDLFLTHVGPMPAEALEDVRARAVSFGLGLQMVNILKDVAADLDRRDCFLPIRLAALYGVRPEELLEPTSRDAALKVVGDVAVRARAHLQRAAEYTVRWPLPAGEPIRLFCAVPLKLALATLDEIERGEHTLLAGVEPRVNRELVARVLADAQEAVKEDQALKRLLAS